MNTYDTIKWEETDFYKQEFNDATEFIDMLNIKSNIIPVVPLKPSEIIPNNDIILKQIIGAYDFDRHTNQNAYIIQRVESSQLVHYRIIQAERTYSHWNIGGILTSFHITIFEADTLNNLVVHALPDEILNLIYKNKLVINSFKEVSPKKFLLAEYGQKLLKKIWDF